MSEQETTRRDTLKLAAAVAAFGAALGFRQTAEASSGSTTPPKDPTPPTTKVEYKVELKLYDGSRVVHSCSVPESAVRQLKQDAKVELKFFVNGKGSESMRWDLKANKRA